MREFDDQKDFEEQQESKNDDWFWIHAARSGELLNMKIDHLNWMEVRHQWIVEASCMPSVWFAEHNFVHEANCWYDGTAVYSHHKTKVGT